MAWLLSLASIAAGLLSKEDERKKSQEAAKKQYLENIDHTRAAQLGASPYSAMGDNYLLQKQAIDRASNSQQNLLGSALQAYSAIGSGVGGGSKDPLSSLGSDRSDEIGSAVGGGEAPSLAVNPLAAGPEAAGGSAVSTMFDELNKKDPWEF